MDNMKFGKKRGVMPGALKGLSSPVPVY